MWVCPFVVGSGAQIAGRSMPGSIFSTKREIAISAPVLPAETQASASPPLTRLMATRIDESFLLRKASAGDSSIPRLRWHDHAQTGISRMLSQQRRNCLFLPTRIRLAAG
jgi:hypothetical protein